MFGLLTKLFQMGLNIYGNILILWTVKSMEGQAFLEESDARILFPIHGEN